MLILFGHREWERFFEPETLHLILDLRKKSSLDGGLPQTYFYFHGHRRVLVEQLAENGGFHLFHLEVGIALFSPNIEEGLGQLNSRLMEEFQQGKISQKDFGEWQEDYQKLKVLLASLLRKNSRHHPHSQPA